MRVYPSRHGHFTVLSHPRILATPCGLELLPRVRNTESSSLHSCDNHDDAAMAHMYVVEIAASTGFCQKPKRRAYQEHTQLLCRCADFNADFGVAHSLSAPLYIP